MRLSKAWLFIGSYALLGIWATGAGYLWAHGFTIDVGRTADGKLLALGTLEDEYCLFPVTSQFFSGWGDDDPSFTPLAIEDPNDDRLRLQAGVSMYVEWINGDAGLQIVSPLNGQAVNDPGEQMGLGGASFHLHPIWHLNDDPQAWETSVDPNWVGRVSVTLRLLDRGSTGYTPSEPFTLIFTNDPYPVGDLDQSYLTEMPDLAIFSQMWLREPCGDSSWCDGADLNRDGRVDGVDLVSIAMHWLAIGCGAPN